MDMVSTKQIRNICLLGHGSAGKTSVAEAMLYISGGTDRLGTVGEGNTVLDYDPEEARRGYSVQAAVAPVMWKDTKINVIDAPGYLGFAGEVKEAVRVADSAVIVVDGKAGIEVGTELAWDAATDAGIPKATKRPMFTTRRARIPRRRYPQGMRRSSTATAICCLRPLRAFPTS